MEKTESEIFLHKLNTERFNIDKYFLYLLFAHFPFALLASYGYGSLPLVLICSVINILIAFLGFWFLRGTAYSRNIFAFCILTFSSILILAQKGRVEMHFHVFGALAFLLIYKDYITIIIASLTIMIEHGLVDLFQQHIVLLFGNPAIEFQYGHGWGIILLHWLFILFESSILVYYAIYLKDQFIDGEKKIFAISEFTEKVNTILNDAELISEKTKKSVNKLNENSQSISDGTKLQATIIEEVAMAIADVTNSMDNICTNANRQAQDLKYLFDLMESLVLLNKGITEKISKSNSAIDKTQKDAEFGNKTLTELTDSMEDLHVIYQKMQGIIFNIHDIAKRINLLALNASIEAARAGEQGRGFAVVAEEVSKLAEQTSRSIKESDILMKTIQSELSESAKVVKKSSDNFVNIKSHIKNISFEIGDLSNAIDEQISSYNDVSQKVKNIKQESELIEFASQEQKMAMKDILDSISMVNQSTQTFSTQSEDLVSLAKDTDEIQNTLKRTIDLLKS